MTAADWDRLRAKVSWPYGRIKLNCDGYCLDIQRQRVAEMRDSLVVYVNGIWKGEWIAKDCEERRRFFRPLKCHVWSRRIRDRKPKLSRKALKSVGVDLDAKHTRYSPFWHSFDALRRHLIKNNKEISLWIEPAAPPSTVANKETNNG